MPLRHLGPMVRHREAGALPLAHHLASASSQTSHQAGAEPSNPSEMETWKEFRDNILRLTSDNVVSRDRHQHPHRFAGAYYQDYSAAARSTRRDIAGTAEDLLKEQELVTQALVEEHNGCIRVRKEDSLRWNHLPATSRALTSADLSTLAR
ncbi:hypothetical protein BC940DRAFT_316162 [Gongronella butleri]|nr:hypothetical protein BC940DRAFT_316162 [Gongronella butleri]